MIGWLGADPELRHTPNNGTAVATLRVATNEYWKERASGERQQRTEWHQVACFGRLAEIVSQYLKKGSYVYFEGRMQTRQYTHRDITQRNITR
ncbi:MAG: single-stranded DNA-binding protein [Gammaproteobacteria bacterium]